jgi:hypothetical protein
MKNYVFFIIIAFFILSSCSIEYGLIDYLNNQTLSTKSLDPKELSSNILLLNAEKVTGLSNGNSLLTWPDTSPSHNDAASENNTPKWYEDGFNGSAYVQFDDSSFRISNLFDGLTSFTVIYIAEIHPDTNEQYIFSVVDGTDNKLDIIRNKTGNTITAKVSSAGVTLECTASFGSANSKHIGAFVLSNKTAQFYMNGIKKGKDTDQSFNPRVWSNNTSSVIGKNNITDSTDTFINNGKMTHVIVFNTALSDTEIAEISNFYSDMIIK